MTGRSFALTMLLQGCLLAQNQGTPFAPGDTFSISHTPITAKLVPLDCEVKKIPIRSYKHAGNEATFLIPEDSPTCTYEVMGTKIRVVRPETKKTAEVRPSANEPKPKH